MVIRWDVCTWLLGTRVLSRTKRAINTSFENKHAKMQGQQHTHRMVAGSMEGVVPNGPLHRADTPHAVRTVHADNTGHAHAPLEETAGKDALE